MKRLSVIVCLFMFALMPLLAQVKQTVAVLGDSYSTFEGFIPKGYATWYTTAVQKATDVNKVEQTWWWQVIKEGGYKMGNINSYSGSTICNTGYRDEDYSDRSFINRTTLLGNPDIILICGGTNDSWANAPYRQLPVQQLEACRPLLFPSCSGEVAFRSPSAPSECRYLLHPKF